MDYSYPMNYDWKTEETLDVIQFFQCVEQAYEKGITREAFMDAYKKFKKIVPSKSEEKTLYKEFEQSSGYSSYHVVKKAIDERENRIQMN
ncbi:MULTISPECIES: UPF0223 family protein [Bacillus]|uniref:UPF0223 protein AM592_04485 n=2 Tax=Bacillus TaxID=1386 RepID=A0A0M4FVV9_9BACI|nr:MULTISPECIES: UPF0223 family protein [Bacillus]ALC80925.1 hypothetical protein AM592_04485 [Bacillus gobiensis]MBP1079872.1 uncharacterized protein YktA (UPF0223 family) [Bacillus capparidis]MED1095259.1 UPF0223 family protein [Bacillus capparidis]